jgi:hypothetical protein
MSRLETPQKENENETVLTLEQIARFADTNSEISSPFGGNESPPPLESKRQEDIEALVGTGDHQRETNIKAARSKLLLVGFFVAVLGIIAWVFIGNMRSQLAGGNNPAATASPQGRKPDSEPFASDSRLADEMAARAAFADQGLPRPTPTPGTTPPSSAPSPKPGERSSDPVPYTPPAPAYNPPPSAYNPPRYSPPRSPSTSRVTPSAGGRATPPPDPYTLWLQAGNMGSWSAVSARGNNPGSETDFPPPPPLNQTIAIGTNIEGVLISPVAWSSEIKPKGRYLIQTTADDPVIPMGSIIVAEIGDTDQQGLIEFTGKAIAISESEYPIPEGSIRITGQNKLLRAQRKGQGFNFLATLGLPFLSALNSATGMINRPQTTSNLIINGQGLGTTTSTSTVNPAADTTAAALQGLTQSWIEQGGRRVENMRNQKIFVINETTPVKVQVTRAFRI